MIENLQTLMLSARDIAEQAGEKIMHVYQQDFDVIRKTDKSPLTEADIAAHRHIIERLSELADYPVLSEESAKLPFTERSSWQTYWLIDPLDGTKQFVQRTDEFCVCIALIHQNQAVLGVIHLPVSKENYFACQGYGAYKQRQGQAARKIQTRKLGSPCIAAVSRSHKGDATNEMLDKIGECELKVAGSAIKACWVAEGKADIYPRLWLTSEWDTAAAQCIVEEAGGLLTTLDLQPMRYNTKDDLLNPYFLVFGDKSIDWSQYL